MKYYDNPCRRTAKNPQLEDEDKEAKTVVGEIAPNHREKRRPRDFAIYAAPTSSPGVRDGVAPGESAYVLMGGCHFTIARKSAMCWPI